MKTHRQQSGSAPSEYSVMLGDVAGLIEEARRSAVRAVNASMTALYWLIGRRIVEHEQAGEARAAYGKALLVRLAEDLGKRFRRGFSRQNLQQMRQFYLIHPNAEICQTPSGTSPQTAAGSRLQALASRFPLPWSAYVRLLSVKSGPARSFYETEALRGGWSVRQLDRQIRSRFYERTAPSRDKAAQLKRGPKRRAEDGVGPEEELKDPYLLEFLDLKNEYSESDLEDALIRHLEAFLLELGGDFCFVGRQRRLRIGDVWYRVDLIFFHRVLRCLVVIDLKTGPFTPADAGQMHLYLNYACEHWTYEGENPPVGLILSASRDAAVAHYALDGLPNPILAAEYRTVLPGEALLAAEIDRTRVRLDVEERAPPESKAP